MQCELCGWDSGQPSRGCTVATVEIDGQEVKRAPFDGQGGVYFCLRCGEDTTDGEKYQGPMPCPRCEMALAVFCAGCRVPIREPHHKDCEHELLNHDGLDLEHEDILVDDVLDLKRQ